MEHPGTPSLDHVAALLRHYVLMPGTPPEVARAAVQVFTAMRFFEEMDGEYELVGRPGVTLDYPPDAGGAIRSAIRDFAFPDRRWNALRRLIRGSGASGTGAVGSDGVSTTRRQAAPFRAQDTDAERVAWHARDLVGDLDARHRGAARALLEFIVGEMKAEGRHQKVDPATPAGSHSVAKTTTTPKDSVNCFEFLDDGGVWTIRFDGKMARFPKPPRGLVGMTHIRQLLLQAGKPVSVFDLQRAPKGHAGIAKRGAKLDKKVEDGESKPAADDLKTRDLNTVEMRNLEKAHEQVEYWKGQIESAKRQHGGLGDETELAAAEHELKRWEGVRKTYSSRASKKGVSIPNSVRQALKKAWTRIGEAIPACGLHLETQIKTGMYCTYFPDPEITPILQ